MNMYSEIQCKQVALALKGYCSDAEKLGKILIKDPRVLEAAINLMVQLKYREKQRNPRGEKKS